LLCAWFAARDYCRSRFAPAIIARPYFSVGRPEFAIFTLTNILWKAQSKNSARPGNVMGKR
jgi:hypothetical protein